MGAGASAIQAAPDAAKAETLTALVAEYEARMALPEDQRGDVLADLVALAAARGESAAETATASGAGSEPQHIVIVHGYILAGTGSNIYSVNVAMALKKMGHAVTCVCQDREAGGYDYVDEFFQGTDSIPATPPAPGSLRVVVPDIADLLPVYVVDVYEGYEVKAIPDCTEEEIERHVTMTAAGLRKVLEQGNVSRVLTNHALLSPVIGKRACEGLGVPFDVKLHGSAMTFVLRDHPAFKKYALEAFGACEKIIAGTSFIVDFFKGIFGEDEGFEELNKKLVIIPPGMDPEVFTLLDSVEANQERFVAALRSFVAASPAGRTRAVNSPAYDTRNLAEAAVETGNSYDQRAADADLAERFTPFAADEPVLVYFGKLLHTKGVGEVILAFMEVIKTRPKVRLLLIGFGTARELVEGMLGAAAAGDAEAFKAFCRAGDFADITDEQIASMFRQLSPEEMSHITTTGMLKHEQLSQLLPVCSLSFMTSKAAEAFGMTSVEAMAAGVFPMMHAHSGILDVLTAVKEVEPELEPIMRIDVREGGALGTADGSYLVEQLPAKINAALDFMYPNGDFADHTFRRQLSQRLRNIVVEQFAWEPLCRRIIAPVPPPAP